MGRTAPPPTPPLETYRLDGGCDERAAECRARRTWTGDRSGGDLRWPTDDLVASTHAAIAPVLRSDAAVRPAAMVKAQYHRINPVSA